MFRFAMKAVLCFSLIGFSHIGAAHAQTTPPKTIKVKLAAGFGWQLCPKADKLPPLEDALQCSGFVATPENIELELVKKPAAKPEWLYYDTTYVMTTEFQNVKSTAELLVMYAEFDGHKMGFIDGRILSEKDGVQTEPIYFRLSAEGGLQNLTYSSTYGSSVKVTSAQSNYSPYVAVMGVAPSARRLTR